MKMRIFQWVSLGAAVSLFGCGSPVPSDMYLSLSVSTSDVAVQTAINGKPNEYLSTTSSLMSGSMPLNKFVREGDNSAEFTLTLVEDSDTPAPRFLASLNISVKGEMVDTLTPGARTIFSRRLTDAEKSTLIAGETITITESFNVNKAALEEIKSKAN
jgi:hypothetical protein